MSEHLPTSLIFTSCISLLQVLCNAFVSDPLNCLNLFCIAHHQFSYTHVCDAFVLRCLFVFSFRSVSSIYFKSCQALHAGRSTHSDLIFRLSFKAYSCSYGPPQSDRFCLLCVAAMTLRRALSSGYDPIIPINIVHTRCLMCGLLPFPLLHL